MNGSVAAVPAGNPVFAPAGVHGIDVPRALMMSALFVPMMVSSLCGAHAHPAVVPGVVYVLGQRYVSGQKTITATGVSMIVAPLILAPSRRVSILALWCLFRPLHSSEAASSIRYEKRCAGEPCENPQENPRISIPVAQSISRLVLLKRWGQSAALTAEKPLAIPNVYTA